MGLLEGRVGDKLCGGLHNCEGGGEGWGEGDASGGGGAGGTKLLGPQGQQWGLYLPIEWIDM